MKLTAFQIALWCVVFAGTVVSIAGVFLIRYFAKKPINGEQKTLLRHDVKIKETKQIVSGIKENLNQQKRQWSKQH